LGAGICKRVIDWYGGALVSRLIPLEGNLIRRRWFSTCDVLPPPTGANDDQVDSVSQLLIWMQQFGQRPMTFVPVFVVSRPRDFPG
jgi:hypothetical protein